MDIKDILEEEVARPRFNMRQTVNRCLHNEPMSDLFKVVFEKFNEGTALRVVTGVIRFSFFIEPVNTGITSTKFGLRWTPDENKYFGFINNADGRWCSYDECFEIARSLIECMLDQVDDEAYYSSFLFCLNTRLVAYEIPIDYLSVPPPGNNKRIHTLDNISWRFSESLRKTMGLRSFLINNTGPNSDVLTSILKDKVAIKSFLTDRAQTGLYQTNREKRWECDPGSVQFALRSTCWDVEYILTKQIFYFDGFPNDILKSAIDSGILPEAGEEDITKCPVTLNPLSFDDLIEEARNPVHGKAFFQVAHLNPLKSVSREESQSGHTSDNISWISSDGNRIQGNLTLEEIRALLSQISDNYRS